MTINGSLFENNYAVNGKGGAIANGGSLVDFGGGFQFANGAVLTVNNSEFNNNEARNGDGGAISSERIDVADPALDSPVTLAVSGSTFDENSASGHGGAVFAEAVQSFDSFKDEYESNTAGGNGDALYFKDATGTLKIENFKDNDADGLGDSMYLEGSPLSLKNIKIEGEDGDDIVIVPGVSPIAPLVSGPAGGVPAGESTKLGFRGRFRFLLCDDELRESDDDLEENLGHLGCSIDGPGR